MWRKHTALFVVSLITSALPVLALEAQPANAGVVQPESLTELTVCLSGCTHTTIQAAVTAASPGDIVNVGAGTYSESVTINKQLTLRGPNAGVAGYGTRVTEAVLSGTTRLMSINAKATIEGFEFKITSGNVDAIYLQGNGDESVIRNNRFIGPNTVAGAPTGSNRDTWIARGMTFTGSPNSVRIEGNVFEKWLTGVFNQGTTGTRFVNNRFESNRTSLSGDNVSSVTYSGNQFVSNYGAGSHDDKARGPIDFSDNTFTDNFLGPTFRHVEQMTGLTFNGNRFTSSSPSTPNTTRLSFSGGTFAAEGNWWGSTTGPTDAAFQKDVSTVVDASPWCSNVSCSGSVTPVTGTGATIDDPDLGSPTFSWTGSQTVSVTVEPVTNPTPDSSPFMTNGARLFSIKIEGLPESVSVKICVDGASPDRLWHYVNSAWNDITNDPAYEGAKVCGTTMSFSPFAIAAPAPNPQVGDGPLPDLEPEPDYDFDLDLDHYRQPEVSDLPDTGSDSMQTLLMWAAVLTVLGVTVLVRGRRHRHV
jgi:LPXTG-motif cell wall-anchored protein